MTDELIRQRLLRATLRHLEDASENIRALAQSETPALDAHTPRTAPQTRPGGTESGEGGGGALRVFFGGDDERRMWTWECTDGHPAAFGDETTEYKAFAALVQHWKTRHPHDLERLAEIKETAPELAISPENASEPAEDLRSAGLDTTPEQAYGKKALQRKIERLDADYSRVVARNAVLEAAQEAHRAQIDAIRAAIEREAAHGDAVTRCSLVAERFRTVLDGASSKAGGNVTDRARVSGADILSPDASDALRAEVERRLRVAYGEDA